MYYAPYHDLLEIADIISNVSGPKANFRNGEYSLVRM